MQKDALPLIWHKNIVLNTREVVYKAYLLQQSETENVLSVLKNKKVIFWHMLNTCFFIVVCL